MARHYALKSFFRQIPNALLARYFKGKGVLQDLDFQAMSETRTPALFDAWMARPGEERQSMEAEFQAIFELSCEKGFRAIIDEMRSQKQVDPEAFTGTLSALPNHYYRAMVTFLDHPECWKGATRFYRADTLSYWRKRKHLGHRPAAVDETP